MHPLTSYIGRQTEEAEIRQMLAQPSCRLLTLVGPGGIGKTRLATHVAGTVDALFARGTTVVNLQPVRSEEFFAPAIADTLGFSLTGQEDPLDQLGHYLRDKEALIVLDNFEHILNAADQLTALLPMALSIKYLVTSREALNVQEEWLYPIEGLRFPRKQADASAKMAYDAVQLFTERAQRVRPDFSPEQEVDAIVHICQLVAGLPLALELAAAWRRSLDCATIAEEIQADIEFLTTRLRNVPARHRSMEAVFSQTWRRLMPREQRVFARLSIFQGGFQRDAAAVVADASLAALSTLVDKSLLRAGNDGRYQVHELLRQYAAEQLAANPDDVRQTQADHATYYSRYLYKRRSGIFRGRQKETLVEIKRELDNVRAAWLWAVDEGDVAALSKMGDVFGLYFQYLGGYREGEILLKKAVVCLEAKSPSEATDRSLLPVLMNLALYDLRFGRLETVEGMMMQAQAIYDRRGIPPLPGHLTDPAVPLGFVALSRGESARAIECAETVRRIAEIEQQPTNCQFAYHILSRAHRHQGDLDVAREFGQQAYALASFHDDQWFMAYILNNLGLIASELGDDKAAVQHFQTSYTSRQAFDDPEGLALALAYQAEVVCKEQDYSEAQSLFQRSLDIYREINDVGGIALASKGAGAVATKQRRFHAAHSHFYDALFFATESNSSPILLSLLIDIAEYLSQTGEQTEALQLLSLAAHNPASDHNAQQAAESLLYGEYQQQTSSALFARAVDKGKEGELDAISAELLHRFTLPPTIAPKETRSDPADQGLIEPLTPRELDVIDLMCDGLTNKEIAAELIIAVGTVKFYSSQIYGKLGVRNRVEAVARAHELNLCGD